MPESSSGDLYWVENQYVMVNMFLKNTNHKMLVYCGPWKIINLLKTMSPRQPIWWLSLIKAAQDEKKHEHATLDNQIIKYEVFKKIYTIIPSYKVVI